MKKSLSKNFEKNMFLSTFFKILKSANSKKKFFDPIANIKFLKTTKYA
jgi:hypothetical protein